MKKTRIYIIVIALLAVFWTFYQAGASGLGPGSPAPELKGGPWLGGEPLKIEELRGKVVLLDMWTFA